MLTRLGIDRSDPGSLVIQKKLGRGVSAFAVRVFTVRIGLGAGAWTLRVL